MFARFDENPAMTLQDIKETKRYGRTHGGTHGQRENSKPHHKQSLRGGIMRYLVDIKMGCPLSNRFCINVTLKTRTQSLKSKQMFILAK